MTLFTKIAAAAFATVLMVSGGAVSAATYTGPITGTPSDDPSFGTRSCGNCGVSTNLLNFNSQVPGREGQIAPHVLFEDWGIGQVTLSFWNLAAAGIAFFEYRIDGAPTGASAHPVVIDDTIHQGVFLANGVADFQKTFFADEYVEIRLALGGERDWDFDWTRFDVAPIPVPAALPLLAGGLALMGFMGWRQRRNA